MKDEERQLIVKYADQPCVWCRLPCDGRFNYCSPDCVIADRHSDEECGCDSCLRAGPEAGRQVISNERSK